MPSPPSSGVLQHTQPQPDSTGVKSCAYEAFRRLRVPREVTALPKRCSTDQSRVATRNITGILPQFSSARRSQTYPLQGQQKQQDPRGIQLPLHNGACGQEVSSCTCQLCAQLAKSNRSGCPFYTLQYSSFASPPDSPPIAMPGVSRLTISAQQVRRRSRSRPP